MSSEEVKDKVRNAVEKGFDKAHRVADVVTFPLPPLDGPIHAAARGAAPNWITRDATPPPPKPCNPGSHSEPGPSEKKIEIASNNKGTEIDEYAEYKPLLDAVIKADWDAAKKFIDRQPNAVRAILTSEGYTALHSAVDNGNAEIVEELVQLMTEQDLEKRASNGWTALFYAARSDLKQMAACMVEKNKKLVSIPDSEGVLPIVVASVTGNSDMVHYLYSVTPLEELSPEMGDNGATVLLFCITAKMFDVALDLLQHFPQLAVKVVKKNSPVFQDSSPVFVLSGMPSVFPSGSGLVFWQRWIYSCIRVQPTPSSKFTRIDIPKLHEEQHCGGRIVTPVFGQLHRLLPYLLKLDLLGVKHIYDTKLIHVQTKKILHLICQQLSPLTFKQLEECLVSEALFRAVKNGIVEFVMVITKANSSLRWKSDSNSRNIFECAILYRQEKIYSLLYGTGAEQSKFKFCLDSCNNGMLHLAGMLAPSARLDLIPGAALQMQRELQWFKEIECFVTPTSRELINMKGYTPYELFSMEHKNLVEGGQKWMKETASSYTLVAALIVTIMFAAAFTIPNSGNVDFSIFSKKKSFQAFIICDSISFLSSTSSLLIFLGILTSRYGEAQFLKSLPTKMILGLTTLFISIASMIVTFCASISLTLHGQMPRIFIPVLILASVPIIIFVLLQSPLLVEIFISTYGRSIFNRKTKCWYK